MKAHIYPTCIASRRSASDEYMDKRLSLGALLPGDMFKRAFFVECERSRTSTKFVWSPCQVRNTTLSTSRLQRQNTTYSLPTKEVCEDQIGASHVPDQGNNESHFAAWTGPSIRGKDYSRLDAYMSTLQDPNCRLRCC